MSTTMDVFVCVSLLALICATTADDLSKGFNKNIDWVTFEEGLKLSKEQNKPLMLLIHKSWCGACKSLKPRFTESKELEELSKKFVMVNTEDDAEPTGDQYQPDGGYIPRILFIDSDGTVKKEVINTQGHASYKYFYGDANSVVTSMKKFLEMHDSSDNKKQPTEEL